MGRIALGAATSYNLINGKLTVAVIDFKRLYSLPA